MHPLLFPPGWVVLLVSLLGYGSLLLTNTMDLPPAVAYVIYALSAYALLVDIAALPRFKRRIRKRGAEACRRSRALRKFRKTSFGKRYWDDRAFRENVSLYRGMAIHFLYTAFRAATGIQYASVWFISLAVYHFLLGVLRAYLIWCYKHRPAAPLAYEYRCYKTLGKLLLLLNLPMTGIIILIIFENSGFVYPGLVIYLSALYTFYMAIVSIAGLRKIRRLDSPILASAKLLHSVSAAMSVMGLQTAMIAQFGQGDSAFRMKMNSLTGAGVCILTLGIALYMIVHAGKKLRKAGQI